MKILFNAARFHYIHTHTHAHPRTHTQTHDTAVRLEADEPELKLHALQFVRNVASFIDHLSDLEGFHNKTAKTGLSHDLQSQPGLVGVTWFRRGKARPVLFV